MQHFQKVAVILTICASAFAQQKRVEMGWAGEKGFFERQTPSVDLALPSYTSDQRRLEFLRAATDNCADVSACKQLKVKVTQEKIGSPFNRSIFQIVYALDSESSSDQPSQPYWKSIVIETRSGLYRELLLLKNEGGFWHSPVSKVDIVDASTTKLLVTNDQTTSRDMSCTGESWVLGESDATLADFSEVTAVLEKAVPTGAQNVTPLCAAVDFGKLEIRGNVQKHDPECSACGLEGQVVVKFRFQAQRAVPVSATFKPETTP